MELAKESKLNTNKPKVKNGKTNLIISRVITYIFLILVTIICLFPFYILIVNCTRTHVEITSGFYIIPGGNLIKNINSLINYPNLPVISGMTNSLIISGATALLTIYFSAMTAYGIHVYNFKLKKYAFAFIMFVMMIPTQVAVLGYIRIIYKIQWTNSFLPIILPSIASPVVFFFMKQYLESVLPFELIEASRVDGCGEFKIFNIIVLPIIKPALAVQAIFSFVGSWNNFFVPSLLLRDIDKKTMPLLISALRSADYMRNDLARTYILITLAIVPLIIVYFFLSKFIIKGVTFGSVKG